MIHCKVIFFQYMYYNVLSLAALRGRSGFLEIVFVGECEVLVCLGFC